MIPQTGTTARRARLEQRRARPLGRVAAALLALLPLMGVVFFAVRHPLSPARREYLEWAPDSLLRWEVSVSPGDPVSRCLLGLRLARSGEARAGLGLVQEAITLAPRSPESALGAAEILMNLDNPRAALAEAERAVEIDPGQALGHRVLGRMLLDVGDRSRAEAELREAIRLDERDPDAWHALGSLLLDEQGLTAEAREALERAVRLDFQFPEARRDLGVVLIRGGAYAEAEAHLRAAIGLAPDDAAARAALGAALRRGQPDPARRTEAEAVLREALRLAPETAGAHFELGMLLVERRRWAEARAALEAAARLTPQKQGVWYHLASVCERLGDTGAAAGARTRYRLLSETQVEVAQALAAVDRDPNDADHRLQLARLHTRREEWPPAVEHLNAALRLVPALPAARALAAELEQRGVIGSALPAVR